MKLLHRIFFILAALLLSACGRAELTRAEAESTVTKSEQISALARGVYLVPAAIDQGLAQGLWDRQRNGALLLRAKAAAEINSVSGRQLIPKSPPTINVNVTGVADSTVSEKIKEVQFTWAYDSLTPVARRLAVSGGTGKALFRQFDDGWRVEGVQTSISDQPIELSAAERLQVEQDIVTERTQQQAIQNFVALSWTPSKTFRQFSYQPAADAKRSAKYGAMKVIITDVDVSYGAELNLNTVWFGHVREIGVSQRGQIYLNNKSLVGGYINEHPEMNPQEVVEVLNTAVNEWRQKYRDNLPSDVNGRYLAAKRTRN